MKVNQEYGHQAIVIGPSEGRNIKLFNEDITVKVKSPNLEILEGTVEPQTGPPLHVHLNQDEAFYVLEGEFAFKMGDEPIVVTGVGGYAFIPKGTKHSYKNIGKTVGKIVSIMTPGGFIDFWDEVAQLPGGKLDFSAVNEIGKRHGNINVGAPL